MRLSVFALLLSVFAAACAGPSPRITEEPAEPSLALADVETFDPAPYRAVPGEIVIDIDHDVPEALLEGTLEAPSRPEAGRPVAGFRIQVNLTENREEAESWREQAISWWEARRSDPGTQDLFPQQLPVYIVYHQPYFKVRIGNFISRERAEEAISEMRYSFPDAWIVPDTVVPR